MTVVNANTVLKDSSDLVIQALRDEVTDHHLSRKETGVRPGGDFIFTAWPNKSTTASSKIVNYPIIVLQNNVVAGVHLTLAKGMRDWEVDFSCDVFSLPLASGDVMMDDVMQSLQDNVLNFAGSGLNNYRITSMSTGQFVDVSNKQVWQKTLNFAYDYKKVN